MTENFPGHSLILKMSDHSFSLFCSFWKSEPSLFWKEQKWAKSKWAIAQPCFLPRSPRVLFCFAVPEPSSRIQKLSFVSLPFLKRPWHEIFDLQFFRSYYTPWGPDSWPKRILNINSNSRQKSKSKKLPCIINARKSFRAILILRGSFFTLSNCSKNNRYWNSFSFLRWLG